MRTGKGNQEEEDYGGGEEDLGSKREGPSSASRDAKESDKASAIRSKHSVTEQRRRSKINERFQVLRELIPNSEQKRDTASFLLEVIDYVQYLQEKVQKYEGSYPGWSQEPTKLTPWRNNHWRVQSLANHPVAVVNNGSVPVIPFHGKFEENAIIASAHAPVAELQNPVESVKERALASSQPELDDKRLPVHPLVQGEQSNNNNECPAAGHGLGLSDDLVIEGGTISISTVYSHELLSSLTQALQNAGIDLSHAKLSVQIDLGKRANPSNKNPLSSHIDEGATRSRNPSVEEDSEHSHKRMKTLSHFS
ncbi:Transcription factor BIM2 [Raphanus sativus]|uniref:Transcription factor BIM2 isoform X2 n=1 Tax=Raphanus sativus TaxID=3726 RepID=A0A6J0MHX4_RAPSA|nr:transcription factor BIM2 isoform X2 [Raphanus sativus]KAJ4909695.1 Transcription factor BIM2 [Raphanus sativus]